MVLRSDSECYSSTISIHYVSIGAIVRKKSNTFFFYVLCGFVTLLYGKIRHKVHDCDCVAIQVLLIHEMIVDNTMMVVYVI